MKNKQSTFGKPYATFFLKDSFKEEHIEIIQQFFKNLPENLEENQAKQILLQFKEIIQEGKLEGFKDTTLNTQIFYIRRSSNKLTIIYDPQYKKILLISLSAFKQAKRNNM